MTCLFPEKADVDDAVPAHLPQYPMPDRHLFEFCSRDYWLSLDAEQLIEWVHGISWYLNECILSKEREGWGLLWSLGELDIEYTGSGRTSEDFDGKQFSATDLYEFLYWASRRLIWLNQGGDIIPKENPYLKMLGMAFFRKQTQQGLWAIVESVASAQVKKTSLSEAFDANGQIPLVFSVEQELGNSYRKDFGDSGSLAGQSFADIWFDLFKCTESTTQAYKDERALFEVAEICLMKIREKNSGCGIITTSVPIVFEELMDSNYWEKLAKDARRLSSWMMVVGTAINFRHDTLEETIENTELEDELIIPCQTICKVFDERENDDNFDEEESTYLAIFGEKEYELRRQKRLTRSSLFDLAIWCIAQLREIEEVNLAVPAQSVPMVFEQLMDANYWEKLAEDDLLLSRWMMVVGTAINFRSSYTLEEIIGNSDLEDELIIPCQTICEVFHERENDDNFDEEESTCLAIFGEKEYKLRKQKQLTRSSLLDFAVWCIARLREIEDVNLAAPAQEVM